MARKKKNPFAGVTASGRTRKRLGGSAGSKRVAVGGSTPRSTSDLAQRLVESPSPSPSPVAVGGSTPRSTSRGARRLVRQPQSTSQLANSGLGRILAQGIRGANEFSRVLEPRVTVARAKTQTGFKPGKIADPKVRVDVARQLLDSGTKIKRTDRGNVVKRLAGERTFGTPTVNQLARAADRGKLRKTPDGRVATRGQVRASRALETAERRAGLAGVTGPLTRGQKTFVNALARETKMSPKVLGAWVLSEMSDQHAVRRENEGNHNWLNIGYFDSGPGALTQDATWGDPKAAAKATAAFLRGEQFGASEGIQQILPRSVGQPDETQIRSIAGSGWASSGYEGGDSLRRTAQMIGVQHDPAAQERLRQARQHADRLGVPLKEGRRDPQPVPQLGELIPAHDGVTLERSSPAILRLGRVIAGRVGEALLINSADRPGATTTSGNQSDHSTGNALDIHALSRRYGSLEDERKGDRIAFEAVIAAGGTEEQARELATNGGALSVTNEDGVRTQIIWKSDVGGDHHNHVHIGVAGATGDGGFTPGVGSFTGSIPAGSVAQLSEQTGMSPAQLDEAAARRPGLMDRMLEGAGFTSVLSPTAARAVMPEPVQPGGDPAFNLESTGHISAVLRRGR